MRAGVVETIDELRALVAPILAGDVRVAAFDTETTEVRDERFTAWGTDTRMAGFSISYGTTDFYAPVRHIPYSWKRPRASFERAADGPRWLAILDAEGEPRNLPLDETLALLLEVLRAPGVDQWIGHEWRFDASMLWADGIEPPWARLFDTKIGSVLTDTRPIDIFEQPVEHGLKPLAVHYLGMSRDAADLVEEARAALRTWNYAELPLYGVLGPYAAMDTRMTLRLAEHIQARPTFADERVRALIDGHMAELAEACRMEKDGIRVDADKAVEYARESEAEVARLVVELRELAGIPLNLGHGETLATQLYVELGLPRYRGLNDTRKATLKQVRAALMRQPDSFTAAGLRFDMCARILDAIMAYRKADKELTSFYRPLTYFGETGHVHPVLRTMEAKTTRYSAAKPNVQQNPRKGNVRTLFLPDPGEVFVLADYAGQELRVAAHYSLAVPAEFERCFSWGCTLKRRGDCKGRGEHGENVVHVGRRQMCYGPARHGLAEGFLSGDRAFDPHQAMSEKGRVDRNTGKTANFAIIYGAGPNKIAETLDWGFEESRTLHRVFWDEAYPELGHVKAFIDERLRRVGPMLRWSHSDHISTLHGGRIYLQTGYYGLNYIIQRSCREILLRATLKVRDYLRRERVPYRIRLPVHDELIYSCRREDLDQGVVREICRLMVQAGAASSVPMVVEPALAENSWGDKSSLPTEWGWHGVNDGMPSDA